MEAKVGLCDERAQEKGKREGAKGPSEGMGHRRKCTVTGLESPAQSFFCGKLRSRPVPVSTPHPSLRQLLYVLVPRRQLALNKGAVGQGSHFSPTAIPKGVSQQGTHTVIKREGRVTFSVHCRTQRVGWTAANSPQALGSNMIGPGTTHCSTQTLLQSKAGACKGGRLGRLDLHGPLLLR